MPDILRVAAVQLNSGEDVAANLATCARLVEQAARAGARLVVLPENFAFMGTEKAKRQLAESLEGEPGPIRRALSHWAEAHSVHVVAGGWPLRSDNPARPYNGATLFSPEGRAVATYRKLHLFDVELPSGKQYRESEGVTPGSEVVCVDVDGFRVGLSICYDLRFPELYRTLVDRGAEVLCIPAAFTAETGRAHWEILCRARAIESQCYVIAPGQTGTHLGDRHTFGHSLLLDPWGSVLASAAEGEAVLIGEVSRAELTAIRQRLPALRHRRL